VKYIEVIKVILIFQILIGEKRNQGFVGISLQGSENVTWFAEVVVVAKLTKTSDF
jgi:hypothetical protein